MKDSESAREDSRGKAFWTLERITGSATLRATELVHSRTAAETERLAMQIIVWKAKFTLWAMVRCTSKAFPGELLSTMQLSIMRMNIARGNIAWVNTYGSTVAPLPNQLAG
jgi:hypothetical protein